MTLLRVLLVLGVVAVLLGAGWDLLATDAGTRQAEAESSTRVEARDCQRRARPVRVRLSRRRWPAIADHVADVRRRFPLVLHLDREGADENRRESLRGVRTRPGWDRDEYPPAVSAEGGEGAHVRLVPSSQNRSSGAYVGNRLRPFCDGQGFRLVVRR